MLALKTAHHNYLLVRNMIAAKNKKIIVSVILFSVVIVTLCIVWGLANMQTNESVSTEKKAVEIALPLAQEYIQRPDQHKDYSIVTTKATFEETDRPHWFVEITFKVERDECYCAPAKGYEVVMWADTGEIYHQGPVYHHDATYAVGTFEISIDKVKEIALPLAQAYAQANNRVITTLTISCHLDNRPYWDVIMQFEAIENKNMESLGDQKGVCGYYVSVWADTGEIRRHDVLNTVGF